MLGPVTLAAPPAGPAAGKDDPKTVAGAAREFEALLIGSLLKSMRTAGSTGWLGAGEDSSSESMLEFAEEQMAGLLAAQGGLGLARLITQGLAEPGGSSAGTRLSPDTNRATGR